VKITLLSLFSTVAALRTLQRPKALMRVVRFFSLLQSLSLLVVLLGPRFFSQMMTVCILKTATAALQFARLAAMSFFTIMPSSSHIQSTNSHTQGGPPLPPPTQKKTLLANGAAFSFSGCSWMLFYHLGVASTLQEECVFPADVIFCGASSGSLVAAALALDVDMRKVREFGMSLHSAADKRLLGPVGDMTRIVQTGLEALFPQDAHLRLNEFIAGGGGLAVSVSKWASPWKVENVLDRRGHFESRHELITLLLCSCYIPLYYETPQWYTSAPGVGPVLALDGGLTDNMPRIDDSTITVSPVRNKAAISPREVAFPASLSLMPGSTEDCESLYQQGKLDAIAYLDDL